MMTMMRTSLRAAQSTLEQRVLCRPLLMWQQKQAQRDLVTVPPRITKGGTIGEQIDLLLKQVDERWDFIQDPKHMGGVLQMLRYCHILKRSLPRGLMLRFVIATDEDDGMLWVLPDAAGVYPGRGLHVAPSRAALSQLVDQGSRICCVIFALLGCSCSLYVCVSFFPAKRVFDVQVDKRPYTLNFVFR
mmetsp:Transcript_13158/g.21387  ORF Transcript_13158/g.21387 Transcript_13158/m.21387 type:complete len:188 (-) Transcript_13158:1397-1960(-)